MVLTSSLEVAEISLEVAPISVVVAAISLAVACCSLAVAAISVHRGVDLDARLLHLADQRRQSVATMSLNASAKAPISSLRDRGRTVHAEIAGGDPIGDARPRARV